jgi:DNA polymerase III delta subunit
MVKDLLSRKLATKDIAKKSGLHPFVVQKTSQSANKFNLDELKRLYTKLLEIDISTKLGQGDLTDYLYNFILAG